MARYISRSGWTSTSASGSRLSGSKLRGVAVHWPGTTQNEIGTSGIANRLRGYRDYHVNTRGWRDIGYNLAIDQAGRVYMLRSTSWAGNMVGAHAASGGNPDANEEYVGVLLLLGDSETPSTAMVEAFRDWYHNRFLPAWPGRTDVRGHRQVPGAQTSCPGSRALAAIDDMTRQPTGGGTVTAEYDAVMKHDGEMRNFRRGLVDDNPTIMAQTGIVWIGDALYKPMEKPNEPDKSWTPRKLWQWGYAHAAKGRQAAEQARDLAQANGAKLDALMDAQQGLDTDAIKAHIDERYQQAASERAELADALDAATEQRGDILALVEQVGSGERDAAEVVDEIARRLSGTEDAD